MTEIKPVMKAQTMNTTTQVVTVDFHGQPMIAVKNGDEIHVAMKPIAEAIGLQWEAQYKRIKRHPVMTTCMSVMDIQMPGDDQRREVATLPLKMLNGWLFGIDANRVKPESRAKLIEYQRECFDVLWQYFSEGVAINPRFEYSVNASDTLTKEQQDTLRDLLTSTVKKLPQEKQASAMIRGWSKLKAHFGTGYRQIPQGEFVEALSIVARHCVTVHALEGELLEAEPKHTSLNETVADLVRQLESPNGAPSAVFMPLVNAVLKKQGFDLSNSPQMKPPAFARSLPSGTPDAKRNLAAVQKVLRNLRSWGIEELPRHVRPDFCDAIAEIDSLLVTGWTEVDEALTRIELGTSFLKRWNQGGGCGIGRIQFIA